MDVPDRPSPEREPNAPGPEDRLALALRLAIAGLSVLGALVRHPLAAEATALARRLRGGRP